VKLPIASQPGSVDAFKAAMCWYDRRIENDINYQSGSTDIVDDIDLKLVRPSVGAIRSGVSSFDNKERVYHPDIGGMGALGLHIEGFRVTSDEAGCGTNKMKVWVAMMWEDSDRNDADGPTYNTTTCEGVAPM